MDVRYCIPFFCAFLNKNRVFFAGLRRISELCGWYDAVARPLLNVYGHAGWHIELRAMRSTARGLPDCGPLRRVPFPFYFMRSGDISRVQCVRALCASVLHADAAALEEALPAAMRR